MHKCISVFAFLVVSIFVTGAGFPQKSKKNNLPTECADGEVAKWDASTEAWVCAPDDDTIVDTGALETQVATNTEDIADLDDRLLALETNPQGIFISVDCATESVAAALASVQNNSVPVHVTISDVCKEQLVIARDDVLLEGMVPTDGFESPAPDADVVVSVFNAHRIRIRNLKITGGQFAGIAANGGSMDVDSVQVHGASFSGISLDENATAFLSNVTIDESGVGVSASSGAHVRIFQSHLHANVHGVVSSGGATVVLWDTIVEDSDSQGVFAGTASLVDISGGSIRNNGLSTGLPAISAHHNATVKLSRDAVVEDNMGVGISVFLGSVLEIQVPGTVTIADNGSDGIEAFGKSVVHLGGGGTVITGNQGHGVRLSDTSLAAANLPIEISSNTGWGVLCDTGGGGAHIIGFFAGATYSGNGSGDVSCPELMLP